MEVDPQQARIEELERLAGKATRAHVEIPFDDPAAVQAMLLGGKQISELKEFLLAHQFMQQNAVTEAGSPISQSFLRYGRKDLPAWDGRSSLAEMLT